MLDDTAKHEVGYLLKQWSTFSKLPSRCQIIVYGASGNPIVLKLEIGHFLMELLRLAMNFADYMECNRKTR